jgi:hypothetical protein
MNYDLTTDAGLANAKQWTRMMMSCIKDKGSWLIPRSGTIVNINHTNKAVIIQRGFADEPEVANIIEQLGYSVSFNEHIP